jgi:hypothetical protein
MRYPQARCSWCGELIETNAARMRLHRTTDSSVRNTRMVASFHDECGTALVEHLESRVEINQALSAPRPAWGRNPKHQ